jgi:hypothetical protein
LCSKRNKDRLKEPGVGGFGLGPEARSLLRMEFTTQNKLLFVFLGKLILWKA